MQVKYHIYNIKIIVIFLWKRSQINHRISRGDPYNKYIQLCKMLKTTKTVQARERYELNYLYFTIAIVSSGQN